MKSNLLINNKKVFYSDIGKGITIVLLHGYLESLEIWHDFANELSKKFRVVSFDIPGHGDSECLSEFHTMEQLSNTIFKSLQKLNVKKCFLIGHSMGGYLTLMFHKLYPELLSGFCLFHSHPFADTEETKKKRMKEVDFVKRGKKDLIATFNIPTAFGDENQKLFKQEVESTIEIALKTSKEGIITNLHAMMDRPDLSESLQHSKIPFLLIAGKKDNYIDFKTIVPKIRLPINSELCVLDNSGHMGFIEEKTKSSNIVSQFILKKIQFFFIFLIILYSCSNEIPNAEISIIPKPLSIEKTDSFFKLNKNTTIAFQYGDDGFEKVALYLQEEIKKSHNIELKITTSDIQASENVILLLQDSESEIGKEDYSLISTKEAIEIKSLAPNGAFYGVQTLLQLIDVNKTDDKIKFSHYIPGVKIQDSPRFTWRGMHLDVCRHYNDKEFVKNYIDLLAMHKMNTFHWHLTEDQGWRIEIKKYPKLTEIGSVRSETMIEKNWDEFDGEPHGGFFTQEDIKEIVQYASDRFITIVPEIEMPGHSLAALAAYPEYGCTGGPYEVAKTWGVFDDVYCAGNDKTFEFLEDILAEVIELFPGEYIHVGGDECPKKEWEKCPKCQQRMKDEGLKDEFELQSYFIRRMEKFLIANNKKLIGWNEILEGGLAPEATVMSWLGTEGGIKAAKMGHDVVMSPNDECYFDHYQGEPENEPFAIGGHTDLSEVYNYEPIPSELTNEEAKYILGAQANLWTEYILSPEHAEYMVLPRMSALSEVVWTEAEQKDFENFKSRLEKLVLRFEFKNYNYRPL
jgi:hexosaminidase